jgi:hypothetical protein
VIVNDRTFFGAHDWHLLNRSEPESLLEINGTSPAIDTAFNTACAPSGTVTTCSCTNADFY